MRVLHLTTEYPPVIYGGLGTAVGGWATASAQAGITVGVFLVEGTLLAEGASHYGAPHTQGRGPAQPVVDRQGVIFFQASWADAAQVGVRLVHTWKPDIVHLHTAMLWYVADAIRRATGMPVVYHVHSVDRAEYEIGQEPNQWLAHSQAQEAAIADSDRLIAISQSERDLLIQYYPTCQDRITTVGNGIASNTGMAGQATARRSRGRLTVLYSGRLVERKGIRDLTAAIPRVLQVAPSTRFVFAGGPPGASGAQLASEWLLPQLYNFVGTNIHFTGWLAPDELAKWYQLAHVLVVPSRYEPFGMVVLEGMLHVLPIIACDAGGPAEILEHGRTGLLFPPKNVDLLTNHIIALVHNPALRSRLGRTAALEVHDVWGWPRLVAKMRQVYDQLVTRARGAVVAA